MAARPTYTIPRPNKAVNKARVPGLIVLCKTVRPVRSAHGVSIKPNLPTQPRTVLVQTKTGPLPAPDAASSTYKYIVHLRNDRASLCCLYFVQYFHQYCSPRLSVSKSRRNERGQRTESNSFWNSTPFVRWKSKIGRGSGLVVDEGVDDRLVSELADHVHGFSGREVRHVTRRKLLSHGMYLRKLFCEVKCRSITMNNNQSPFLAKQERFFMEYTSERTT